MAEDSRICSHRLLLVAGSVASLCSCGGPRYFIVQCDEPPSRSAIAWQVTSAHPGVVRGRVLRVSTGLPADRGRGVHARLVGDDTATQRPDADGEIRFAGVQGTRELTVRGFGYMPATATLSVPVDSGVDVLVALEERSTPINEICGTRQRR